MRDAYSFWARVFTALGAVITRAYHDVILWILPDTPPPPPRSLHVIQGQPPQT